MNRGFSKLALLLALPVFLLATADEAEAQVRFGPQISWADDAELGIGGRITGDVNVFENNDALRSLRGIGEFIYYTDDLFDLIEINLNGALPVRFGDSGTDFYAGGGLNIANGNSDTEIGINLLGGLNFDLGNLDAFAEAGIRLNGSEQFVITGGLMLGQR